MNNIVPMPERKRRNKMLRILSAKKLRAFYESQKSKSLEVIFEYENKAGFMFGYTQNYVKVKYPYNHNMCNMSVKITPLDFDEAGVMTCSVEEAVCS
jgi:threonylcarbamoyladenosine tRNA methylthiotransferase MtaB